MAEASCTSHEASAERLGSYDVHEHLGSGTSGSAYRVTDQTTRKDFVMKKISLLNLSASAQMRVKQEIMAMYNVDHPNVVQFRESFADESSVNIIMEHCPHGTLGDLIARQRHEGTPFPGEVLIEWMAELLCALAYIHAQGILHRDIKTTNIFVTANNHLKLGDFGVCALLSDATLNEPEAAAAAAAAAAAHPISSSLQTPRTSSKSAHAQTESSSIASSVAKTTHRLVGTPLYFAPEVCEHMSYDQCSDVWSLGVVFYEMCTLRRPFNGRNLYALIQCILHTEAKPFHTGLDARFEDIVLDMLSKNPRHRPIAQDLIDLYLEVPPSHPSHPSQKPSIGRYVQRQQGPVLRYRKPWPARISRSARAESHGCRHADNLAVTDRSTRNAAGEKAQTTDAASATPVVDTISAAWCTSPVATAISTVATTMMANADGEDEEWIGTSDDVDLARALRCSAFGTSEPSTTSVQAATHSDTAQAGAPPASPRSSRASPATSTSAPLPCNSMCPSVLRKSVAHGGAVVHDDCNLAPACAKRNDVKRADAAAARNVTISNTVAVPNARNVGEASIAAAANDDPATPALATSNANVAMPAASAVTAVIAPRAAGADGEPHARISSASACSPVHSATSMNATLTSVIATPCAALDTAAVAARSDSRAPLHSPSWTRSEVHEAVRQARHSLFGQVWSCEEAEAECELNRCVIALPSSVRRGGGSNSSTHENNNTNDTSKNTNSSANSPASSPVRRSFAAAIATVMERFTRDYSVIEREDIGEAMAILGRYQKAVYGAQL